MEKFQPDEDLLFLVKTLNKELALDFDKRLSEFGLTGSQGRLLFFLHRKVTVNQEVIHQNDLEKTFGLSKSTVSGLVDRLAKKELIERINDKPYISLVPTANAVKIVDSVKSQRNKTIEKLTQGLSEDDVERMKNNIKLLIKNIKEEDLC